MSLRAIAACFAVPALIVAAAVSGRLTAPTPAPVKPPVQPSPEQLTIAAATLVHGLEVQQDYSLSQSPDFVQCRTRLAGGWFCDYSVTYVDESSATWELTLNRANVPTLIRRLKSFPAPPTG